LFEKSAIIRVPDPSTRRHKLSNLLGDIPLSSFIDIVTAADLEANVREAKRSDGPERS
jgi:hypothetical protein